MKNINKILMMLLLTSIVLVASAGAASAQSYYVSTNGNDGNNGMSMNQAFGTVEHGSSQLTAGDTLYIGGGTYWNDQIRFERSGTADNWITVTNYNDEKVKMYHDEEFNSMTMISITDISYIHIENIETSHYGSCVYISGKYRGDTHDIKIYNVDSLRSYSRGYACNGGAHNIHFEDILIKDVQHPTSAPNAFDFLTSPHDEAGNAYSDFCIHHIKLINVDIDYVYNHGGFNFGQGLTPDEGGWDSHWEGELCNNFYFDGCDVKGAAGAGYYCNKYVLRDSVIKNCDVSDCFNGMGIIGDNLLIENVVSHDNDMNGLYFMWDTESRDVTIKCYEGYGNKINGPALADGPEFTIIECGSESEPAPEPEQENDSESDSEDPVDYDEEQNNEESNSDMLELVRSYDFDGSLYIETQELKSAGVDKIHDKINQAQLNEIVRYWINDIKIEEEEQTSNNWKDEWYGEDSADGEKITTEEMQHASFHWIEDKPVRGHILTTEELQEILTDWINE